VRRREKSQLKGYMVLFKESSRRGEIYGFVEIAPLFGSGYPAC